MFTFKQMFHVKQLEESGLLTLDNVSRETI